MTTLTRTEARLYLRDPGPLLVVVLLPAAILALLGAIPALREPAAVFGGLRFTEYFAPSLLAIAIAASGLQTMPTTLATYRERGILRRLSTTPMRPSAVLLAQLVINVLAAAAGTAVMVGVAVGVFGVPAPRHPLGFAAAFVLGTAAVFGIGLLIAALAPRAKAATAVGGLLFVVSQLFSGVYLPKFLLPDVIVRIGEYVPPGIGAFQAAWLGDGPALDQLAAMAVVALLSTVAAARFFRWE
jgi:ABC-2 type transport system permease protein